MGSFLHLLAGENKKIWRQKPAVIMLIILLGVYLILSLALIFGDDKMDRSLVKPIGSDFAMQEHELLYKNGMIITEQDVSTYKNSLESSRRLVESFDKQSSDPNVNNYSASERYDSRKSLQFDEKDYAIKKYRFDNNMFAYEDTDIHFLFCGASVAIFSTITTVGMLIIGTVSVAGETSDESIRLLLIRPFKRWKVLTAKFLSVLLYALFMYALGLALTFILGGVLFGFDGFNSVLVASFGRNSAFAAGVIPYTLLKAALSFAKIVIFISIVFLISSLLKSRALTVGIVMVIYFLASPAFSLLAMLDIDFTKYLIFFNLDLNSFLSIEGPAHPALTFVQSAVAMAVHFVAFMAISYAVFIKRDVK